MRSQLEKIGRGLTVTAPATTVVCTTCGSDDVLADAYAKWTGHAWEMLEVFDQYHCEMCGGECSIRQESK